jgi:transcriptional regulator with XRE-family HTH domain
MKTKKTITERFEADPQSLRDWQKRMGFTYDDAAAALGMSRSSYAALVAKVNPVFIDLRTALACAAIELGVEPIAGRLAPYTRGPKK